MLLILWIVHGMATGFLVGLVVSKRQNAWPVDVLLGVTGSVVAGQISILTDSARIANPGSGSLFVATAGAIVTVVAYRTVTRRRHA